MRSAPSTNKAKAPALLFKDSGDIVPGLDPSRKWSFDLFLSYAWKSSQDLAQVVKLRVLSVIPKARVFYDLDQLKELANLASHVQQSAVFCALLSADSGHGRRAGRGGHATTITSCKCMYLTSCMYPTRPHTVQLNLVSQTARHTHPRGTSRSSPLCT